MRGQRGVFRTSKRTISSLQLDINFKKTAPQTYNAFRLRLRILKNNIHNPIVHQRPNIFRVRKTDHSAINIKIIKKLSTQNNEEYFKSYKLFAWYGYCSSWFKTRKCYYWCGELLALYYWFWDELGSWQGFFAVLKVWLYWIYGSGDILEGEAWGFEEVWCFLIGRIVLLAVDWGAFAHWYCCWGCRPLD